MITRPRVEPALKGIFKGIRILCGYYNQNVLFVAQKSDADYKKSSVLFDVCRTEGEDKDDEALLAMRKILLALQDKLSDKGIDLTFRIKKRKAK